MKLGQKCMLLVLFMPVMAVAQEGSPASMVRRWTEGTISPAATIADMRWIVGDWQGGMEGGMQEHAVFAPTKGHMPGFARGWGQDGSVWFYEMNDFVEVGGSIEFRVKHFSGDLADREGRSEYVRHRLIAKSNGAMYFDGITFVQDGPEHHTVYFQFPDGEKKGQILVVHQTRVSQR
jgi:hypothetical protein